MPPEFDLKLGDTTLHLAGIPDAEFILELRTDEKLNRYISETKPDVAAQIAWLAAYKQREARGEEYYFIIRHQSKPVGTIRIHDLNEDSFTAASWIIKRGTHPYVSVASVLLGYHAGFDFLHYKQARFEVQKGNEPSFRFHRKMGAVAISEDDHSIQFQLAYTDYCKYLDKFRRFAGI
ncbi:MAG: GNAT family N-acetyltransferase [Luteolibacter sp.]|jgi:RimJ/RimL family protein N-acetyltransferase|nr:GNAT family N-acetyltransferase [Luteolibacter sp.]